MIQAVIFVQNIKMSWCLTLITLIAFICHPSPIFSKSFHKLEEIIASNKLLALHNSTSNLFTFNPKPSSKHVSRYGMPCTGNEECAPKFGLTCTNSSCLCSSPEFIARVNPDKSQENHQRIECVLRAGSKCYVRLPFVHISQGEQLESTRTLSAAYFWNKLRKNVPFLTEIAGAGSLDFFDSESNCVDNAHCIGGVCRCSPDHFRDYRGLCLRKRSILQLCDNDNQCRASEGLRCIQAKCQCTNSMVFDHVKRKCFIPVGGECDAYSSTVETECVRNADCSNDRCVCLEGYKMSSDGTCGVDYGGLCDMQTNTCSDIQLTCRSGRCQCRYPVHQIYNETLEQCISKPDGPCIPTSLIFSENEITAAFQQNCVSFADCVRSTGLDEANAMFDYVCKCIPGYAEDSSGNCVPSFSAECIDDEDCDQAIGQLTCINGRCVCPDEMLAWDETRRKCVGVVGARCKQVQLERILSINFRLDVPKECVENAVCAEHVVQLDGRCECKIGYEFSKTHLKCFPT